MCAAGPISRRSDRKKIWFAIAIRIGDFSFVVNPTCDRERGDSGKWLAGGAAVPALVENSHDGTARACCFAEDEVQVAVLINVDCANTVLKAKKRRRLC